MEWIGVFNTNKFANSLTSRRRMYDSGDPRCTVRIKKIPGL